MSKRVRRFKVPPISQSDVNNKTTQKLEEQGADKHVQALFFKILASEVINSGNPLLAALIPHIKRHKSTAWIAAFQIVADFLQANNMTLTSETIRIERPATDDRMNLSMLLHIHGKTDHILQLLTLTAKHRSLPAKQKIAELADQFHTC